MSQFEFVIVLTSFVVAFGVSHLLSGWGRIYLARHTSPPHPLQLAASMLLLLALLQSLWGYWGFRSVEWTFGGFLVALTPLLLLAGAAALALPPNDQVSGKEHYARVSGALFFLLAGWVAVGFVTEVWLVEAEFHAGQIARLLAVLVLAGLSRTTNESAHWAGLALLAVLQLVFAWTVTPALG